MPNLKSKNRQGEQLSLSKTVARPHNLSDPRHLMRFLKAEALSGTEAEKVAAIAKAEGVSAATVRESIRTISRYRAQNSTLELDLAIRDLAISAVPKAKETLQGLLGAMEMVEVPDQKTGGKKVIQVEDKTTRIEAMRLVNQLIANLQPKQAPVEVNVSQTNQVATNLSSAETMEERLRRLRRQATEHNLLPPEVSAVPDAVDAGGSIIDAEDDDDEGEDEDDE